MPRTLSFILIFSFCISCKQSIKTEQKGSPLARVGSKYLYEQDLSYLLNDDVSPEDSAKLVDAYINTWINRQSFIQYANKQISETQSAQINEKVKEYEESLLSYLFEEKFVESRLDTVITNQEYLDYYNQHQEDFRVNEPVLKYFIIKRDQPFKNNREIYKLIATSIKDDNDSKLIEFCSYQAISCDLNLKTWQPESKFLVTFTDEKNTINTQVGKPRVIQVGKYYYLYQILDRIDNGTYPIDYVKPKIKQIVLRDRKQALIEELRSRIYNQAKNNNEIEIFE